MNQKGSFVWRSEIGANAETVFKWHEATGAFDRLNPPWEPVRVISRSGGIRDGAKVSLRIPLGPAYCLPCGFTWTLEHRDYIPGQQFKDIQIEGPFRSWLHTHRFEELDSEKSILEDAIDFELPPGLARSDSLANLVRKKLSRLFRYRHVITTEDLKRHKQFSTQERFTILVTGSSGFVGSALIPFLTTGGHRVVRLIRRESKSKEQAPGEEYLRWNSSQEEPFPDHKPIDAVIHLAGEPIVGRWNEEKKWKIRQSRIEGTKALCEALVRLEKPPKVIVCASAVGYYGNSEDALLTEQSPPGKGFLSVVCQEWEQVTRIATNAGIRVVNLRVGIVLSPAGGALQKMLPAFQLGLGGPLGKGNHYMSWISIDDLIYTINHCLFTDQISGAVNCCAPNPCTNLEFTRTLGKILRRPTFFTVPPQALRLAFGELAEEGLLSSQRAIPKKLLQAGFSFSFPELSSALQHGLGR